MRAENYEKGKPGFKPLSGFLSLPVLCIPYHSCDFHEALIQGWTSGNSISKNTSKYNYFHGVWWCTAIISGLGLRQRDNEFEVRLSQNK